MAPLKYPMLTRIAAPAIRRTISTQQQSAEYLLGRCWGGTSGQVLRAFQAIPSFLLAAACLLCIFVSAGHQVPWLSFSIKTAPRQEQLHLFLY